MLTPGRIILLVGVALFVALPPYTARASGVCLTNAVVRKNGDVVIEGKVYSNQASLKTRILDLKSRKPNCFVSLTSENGASPKTIEHVVSVLRQMGVSQIGILTEPRNP